jgi:hypothetical protein
MVYTVRYSGGRGGRNAFEKQLRRLHIVQKNSRPNHPTTCGKVERFQQTMKKWLRAQPSQPTTIDQLQTLLDAFAAEYNHDAHTGPCHTGRRRPRSTPLAPKATPSTDRSNDTHNRVRHDKISKTGTVTLRIAGRLRHIGIGRTHAGTYVRSSCTTSTSASSTPPPANSSATSPRPHRDYQPTTTPTHPTKNTSTYETQSGPFPMS